MGYIWMGGKNGNKLLSCQRKRDTRWKGRWREGESIVLPLTFKALKRNVFTITAYKDVIFMLPFRQSETDRYQSISIYLSIVIENRYQSITTRIFVMDGSSIININRLIDIDWYWLISIVIDYRFHRSDTWRKPRWCPPGWATTWQTETNINIYYRVLLQNRKIIPRGTHKH